MKKTLRAFGAGMLGAAAVAAMAMPAGAQEGPPPTAPPEQEPDIAPGTIVDITLDGCDIVVTFIGAGDGEHHIEVWDDGEQIGDVPVTTTTGATAVGRYTITAVVKQGASGLGIELLGIDAEYLDGVDPYNGADDVIEFCASQEPQPEPEPGPDPVVNIEPVAAPAAAAVVADPDYTG